MMERTRQFPYDIVLRFWRMQRKIKIECTTASTLKSICYITLSLSMFWKAAVSSWGFKFLQRLPRYWIFVLCGIAKHSSNKHLPFPVWKSTLALRRMCSKSVVAERSTMNSEDPSRQSALKCEYILEFYWVDFVWSYFCYCWTQFRNTRWPSIICWRYRFSSLII